MTRRSGMAGLFLAVALAAAPRAQAESVADFYKGKTVRVVIGTNVGGTYGVYGQLVARHFGRFVPGHPTVAMQSMPGAGGFVALNWLGTAAPRDGTVVTVAHTNIVHEGLLNREAKFDPRAFLWVGRFTTFMSVGVASKKSGVRSLADAKTREVTVGAPAPQAVPAQAPIILNRVAGTKFKIVSGYRSTGDSFLAVERGEVDMAGTSMDALRALHWPKIESGELTPIFVQGVRRLKEFPHAPTLAEFGNTAVEKAFLGVFNVTAEVGRSLATPPGVPSDRLEALRAAYQAMLADPAFLADVKKLRIVLDPLPGAEQQAVIGAAMKMSRETQEQARKFYEGLFKGH